MRFDMDAGHVMLPMSNHVASHLLQQPRSRSASPERLADEIPLHTPRPTQQSTALHAPDAVLSTGDASSHMTVLTRLEDPEFSVALRELADTRMDGARKAVAHARAESIAAHVHNFTVADRDFRDRERAAVRALLLRTSRACARLHDAVEALEAAEIHFLAEAGASMRAACDRSHAEGVVLDQKLAHERKCFEIERGSLHEQLRAEKQAVASAKAEAAANLAGWEACKVSGAAEVAGLTHCFGRELTAVETMASRFGAEASRNWASYTRAAEEFDVQGHALRRSNEQLEAANAEVARLQAALAAAEEARRVEVAARDASLKRLGEEREALERDGRVRVLQMQQALDESHVQAEAELNAMRRDKETASRELNEEVDRLRKVQAEALAGGGGASGGVARQKLFFEAMKPRDPKQPSTMSWRGVTDGMIKGSPPPKDGTRDGSPATRRGSLAPQAGLRVNEWRARASARAQ